MAKYPKIKFRPKRETTTNLLAIGVNRMMNPRRLQGEKLHIILPKKFNARKIKKSPTGPENSANVINQFHFLRSLASRGLKKKKFAENIREIYLFDFLVFWAWIFYFFKYVTW